MKYQISENNGIATARISGQMTFDDRNDAVAMANALTATNPMKVEIDLTDVDYVDSAGLGILLTLREQAQGKKAVVSLKGAQGSVKEVLELACFDTLFDFEP